MQHLAGFAGEGHGQADPGDDPRGEIADDRAQPQRARQRHADAGQRDHYERFEKGRFHADKAEDRLPVGWLRGKGRRAGRHREGSGDRQGEAGCHG